MSDTEFVAAATIVADRFRVGQWAGRAVYAERSGEHFIAVTDDGRALTPGQQWITLSGRVRPPMQRPEHFPSPQHVLLALQTASGVLTARSS